MLLDALPLQCIGGAFPAPGGWPCDASSCHTADPPIPVSSRIPVLDCLGSLCLAATRMTSGHTCPHQHRHEPMLPKLATDLPFSIFPFGPLLSPGLNGSSPLATGLPTASIVSLFYSSSASLKVPKHCISEMAQNPTMGPARLFVQAITQLCSISGGAT